MGYPYDSPTWDAATAGMYMGYGGSMPAIFTVISVVVCIVLLWKGNKHEHDMYAKYK